MLQSGRNTACAI